MLLGVMSLSEIVLKYNHPGNDCQFRNRMTRKNDFFIKWVILFDFGLFSKHANVAGQI